MTEEIEDDQIFKCDVCGRLYRTERGRDKHVNDKHTEPEEIIEVEEIIPEPEPEVIIPPPPKKKRKKEKVADWKKAYRDSKKGIVKANHKLWRSNPLLAPKGWVDNKRGE